MSFRGAFTRDSGGSENLQYDDTAAYHFYLTILLIIVLPLIYSIIKSILYPFGHIPHLKEIENKNQFKQRIIKFKKDNKFCYVTKWFVLKVVIIILLSFAIYRCFTVLNQTGLQMKGFDPYQILEVDPDATIEKIKKSYRKLALKYHPDRNQDDPQANAKFIMISKAYQCLTNQQAKQNCLKYGNPQGSTAFNVGIALPSFLVKKQNQVAIMGIVLLLVVIVLPAIVIYYQSQVNKYDDTGMLLKNYQNIYQFLNQHYSIKDCLKTIPLCFQFQGLKSTSQKQICYQNLLDRASDQTRTTIKKKKYLKWINKAMILIDARLQQQKVPNELNQDYRYILKTVPVLVKGLTMIGLSHSTQQFKYYYKNQKFVGITALCSIIMFGQYFIQGKSYQSQSFQQIHLTSQENQKIFKKKKNKKITQLKSLIQNIQDRQYFLNLLSPQRKPYILECIEYFPKVQMETIIHTAGDKQITTMDVLQCIVTLKANRPSNFCSSYSYPFLKLEGWYIIISDGIAVLFLEYFNFDKDNYQVKFNRRPHQSTGTYSLTVHLLSDCYFGLDIEKTIKYQIKSAKKLDETSVQTSHKEEQEEGSFFSKIMSSVMPKEQEQLSDKQD